MMRIILFFAASNVFVISTRPAGSPLQQARCVYFSHVCGNYSLLTTYQSWSQHVKRRTKSPENLGLNGLLWIVFPSFYGYALLRAVQIGRMLSLDS